MIWVMRFQDAVKEAGAKLLMSKDEEIHQLNSKIQEVLQGKAQEKQLLEAAIAILEQGNCEQMKKVCVFWCHQ